MPTNTVRAVLEAYSITGVLGLAHRDGNRRYYDLLERLLPADLLARSVPPRSNSATSSSRATALTASSGSAAAVASSAASAPRSRIRGCRGTRAERHCARSSSTTASSFPSRSRTCAGSGSCSREEVDLLERPPEPPPSVAFLPPFDPLVWDRGLLGSLFEFDYVWELFLPPAKRRWGWYVLPMLFRDRLVGRIEPRIDRAGGQVQVLGLWWEDGFAPRRTEGFVDAMRDALRAYLRFGRATRLEWAPQLAMEKRLFLARP